MASTPNRRTVLQIGVGEVTLSQQAWSLQREAQHIKPLKQAGSLVTENVFSPSGDAWLLRPQFHEAAQALKTSIGGYIPAEHLELAPGFTAFDSFRARTDLPNVGTGAGVLTTGAPTFQKRVAAGDDWDAAQLAADAAALPPPPADVDVIVPQDRVVSGLISYAPNTPFAIQMRTPEGWDGKDAFFSFYFGGETETLPDGTSGGHYCLVFRGGGDADLWERDEVNTTWGTVPRERFRWNAPGASPGGLINVVALIPYARDRIWLGGNYATPYSVGGWSLLGLLGTLQAGSLKSQPGSGVATLLRETYSATGHRHVVYATGEGTVRVDQRRDLRMPFSLLQGVYPAEGTLIDSPFEINRNLPAGTPISLSALWYRYDNTNLTVQLYDADTGAALTELSSAVFASVAGQRKYFAVFTFTSDDGIGTPAFFGYQIDVPGFYTENAATPLITDRLTEVRIIGPDLEPTHDEATVQVVDEIDEASILRTTDGLRTLVTILDRNTDAVISHIFEGETNQPAAMKQGRTGDTYPSPDWHDTTVKMTGLYPRLEEQFHDAPPFSFADSSTSPHPLRSVGPNGTDTGFEAWRVTDVIRWLLNRAGVRDDELDIPDIEFRLWTDEHGGGDNMAIQPGTTYGTMAATLVKDLLGAALVRDPNAGARGMWRVLIPPVRTSTNYLWRFSVDPPPTAGKLVHYPGAFGVSTSYILDGSWQRSPQRPRGTTVTVWGVDAASGNLIQALYENFDAIAYLGRRVPITRGVDPALQSQEACNWVARRINDVVCQPRSWFDFVAPLVLVTDPLDPLQVNLRPLRVNDLILIRDGGVDIPAILRSVNPGWSKSDDYQTCHYEGRTLAT